MLLILIMIFVRIIDAGGLVDNSIVGDKITYLDGTSWEANTPGASSDCIFETATDFKHGTGGGDGTQVDDIKTKEECCGLCLASSTCVAATWCEPGSGCDNQCWMKKAADISGGNYTHAGRVGCVKKEPCIFEANTDFKYGAGGGDGTQVDDIKTKEECCGLCLTSSSCAAATWCEPGSGCDNQCWLKKAIDISGGNYTRAGRIGCVKKKIIQNVFSDSISIHAKVPGDLITDLQNAGLIGDPLYEKNFKNASMWSKTWTYTTSFQLTDTALASNLLLVFDGIKMGASIRVNGVELGQAADQFLRYVFPLKSDAHALRVGANKLEVVFQPDINVNGRFMACTGGWDWAPYTTTRQGGISTFSKGIWKSVYIVEYASVAITHVVPQVFYKGPYPTVPLEKGKHGDFDLETKVFFETNVNTKGTLEIKGSWGASAKIDVTLPVGNTSVRINMTAAANDIDLWWPAGLGKQSLYQLDVSFTPASDNNELTASRKIGFRYFALVTGNDTDPAYVEKAKSEQGTEHHGMYFRVNGAVIWARGANMIPMEELEGRMSAEAHRFLVQSAADGGMNILRVWGGGIFLPEEWYDACDELGIMVFHDMQYAQGGHAPQVTATQDAELRHNIRRLSAHPSIVLWDGCNECRVIIGTNTGIYATFVMTVVAEEDKSRSIWPSCPAVGWTSGVKKLDALPNGKELLTPRHAPTIETHGPYQHGNGFPAVNGGNDLSLFDSLIPNQFSPTQMGPQFQNVFASEFGTVVMSSFESMSPTLHPKHWALEAGVAPDSCSGGFAKGCKGDNPMAERNYPCNNIIDVYFGRQDEFFNITGENPFKQQLYQCMMGQALNIKANIEHRRSTNSFGCIVWQYNEIWPTGGWGSIEYGTPVKGQVIGGRWKPLQYWYKSSIYADVMATCGTGGQCYVKNDSPYPFVGSVKLTIVAFKDGKVMNTQILQLNMPAGAGTTKYFKLNATVDGTKSILLAKVMGQDGSLKSWNVIPYATPEHMQLSKANIEVNVGTPAADKSVAITLNSDKPALYVLLTTTANGRFSDNAFFMQPGEKLINFIPFGSLDLDLLKASLRIEHVATYKKIS